MAINKDRKRVVSLIIIAIFISFFLSINSAEFRIAGLILAGLGIFCWLVYKRGSVI